MPRIRREIPRKKDERRAVPRYKYDDMDEKVQREIRQFIRENRMQRPSPNPYDFYNNFFHHLPGGGDRKLASDKTFDSGKTGFRKGLKPSEFYAVIDRIITKSPKIPTGTAVKIKALQKKIRGRGVNEYSRQIHELAHPIYVELRRAGFTHLDIIS